MNRYLMLSAATLLATAGNVLSANASTTPIYFNSGCSGIRLTNEKGNPSYAAQYFDCNGTVISTGLGLAQKSKGLGKHVDLSNNYFAKNYGIFSEYLNYDISLPLKDGGTWTSWVGLNGTSSFEVGSGTYNIDGPRRKGGSVSAEMKAILEKLKAAGSGFR